MNALDNTKIFNAIPPGVIKDDASFTAVSMDCRGYNRLEVLVTLGATDIAMAALKLQASDNDSSYSDVTGCDFSGALPSATDDNGVFRMVVPQITKRYYKLVATAGDGTAGTYLSAVAIATKPTSRGTISRPEGVTATVTAT